MSEILLFRSNNQIAAQNNLDAFIGMCRDELTTFADRMCWDDWRWPKIANFTTLAASGRTTDPGDAMKPPFINFAKAYFRYQQGHNPTGERAEIMALKILESLLSKYNNAPDIADLTPSLLDQAAVLAREHYKSTDYKAGRELQRLASFVSKHRLINTYCGDWVNPIKRPQDHNKVGKVAQALRDKRLPTEESIMAMADVFSQNSLNPKDIFISSVFALMMSVSSRISEILTLPVDCETYEKNGEGVECYGLKFFSAKGFGVNIKYPSTVMAPIAKEAIRRLRTITEHGRLLCKAIEESPDEIYKHPNCPDVDPYQPLTLLQACEALNLKADSAHDARTSLMYYGFKDINSITLAEIWEYSKTRLPEGFPWVSEEAGVKYSRGLFTMLKNQLHATRGNVPFVPWLPNVNIANNDFSPRLSLGEDSNHQSIFDRFGFNYADGSRMKITTHQLRHLVDTMGHRGGLSEEEIARFAGRADMKQNRTYNHVTELEQVERLENYRLQSAVDYGGELIHHRPVSKAEYELMPKGPMHLTLYGVCSHDFIMSPCQKTRDCTNCEEHICVKRDDDRKSRLEELLKNTRVQLFSALDAVEAGYFGADRWLERHQLSVGRLEELLAILNDPNVAEGALIRLKNDKSFSHLNRALSSRQVNLIANEAHRQNDVVHDLLSLMGGNGLG